MNHDEILEKLNELRSLPAENEIVEFKTAKNSFGFDDLGKYFSALSNEANLNDKRYGWLVFGVENKNRDIVGTNYRKENRTDLDSLKLDVANKTTNRITFVEIYELNLPEGRVVMFQIPAAPRGLPVAWQGHYFGRDNESLVPLNAEEYERIRRQSGYEDWSAATVPNAKVEMLNARAIAKAKENYIRKNPRLASDIEQWSTPQFLTSTKMLVRGQLTRAAVLLLGDAEATALLQPVQAQITWVLYTKEKVERDYQHFYPPFILTVDEIYAKIRNLKYRYMKDGTLFPEEVDQYDPLNIKEALSNCIAHMDYTIGGRVTIAENEDAYISFSNPGSFLPGTVEQVIKREEPPVFNRNSLLAETMVAYNMIDSIGSGIKRMFRTQKQKFFPLPDYELSSKRVKVTLIGKVLDLDYARVLARNPNLTLEEIMMLDKVQKRKVPTDDEIKQLRQKGLIEGKKPHLMISAKLAQTTGQKADYTRKKAFDKQAYFDWIVQALKDHNLLTRRDIDELLWDRLSDMYDDRQKKTKITNLIAELRRNGIIENSGTDAFPRWVLTESYKRTYKT